MTFLRRCAARDRRGRWSRRARRRARRGAGRRCAPRRIRERSPCAPSEQFGMAIAAPAHAPRRILGGGRDRRTPARRCRARQAGRIFGGADARGRGDEIGGHRPTGQPPSGVRRARDAQLLRHGGRRSRRSPRERPRRQRAVQRVGQRAGPVHRRRGNERRGRSWAGCAQQHPSDGRVPGASDLQRRVYRRVRWLGAPLRGDDHGTLL